MAESYQRPVARLFTDAGRVVGAGFLAPRGVIVTCAHVVNDALSRSDQLCKDRPTDSILLDLPWAGGGRFRGKVIDWRPPIEPGRRQGEACVDIAVLELDGILPVENAILAQPPTAVFEDTTFKVIGFPDGSDAGAPARGSVRGSDAGGWHHVEPDRSYGRTFEEGFSGAPAITDGPNPRLLGMIDISNREERRGVLIPATALMRAWPPLAEPYRGLKAFREEDALYFFGRERFTKLLWRSFERHPMTLLIGPSGSGKSSLINAGFLPRLRAERCWRFLRFHPGDRPITHLCRELITALEPGIRTLALADETAKRQKALLSEPELLLAYGEACHQATGHGLCIVVDQMEETFTLAQPAHPDQHRAFIAALASLAGQHSSAPVKAILGLRSDFLSLLQSESDEAAATLLDAVNGEPTVMLGTMVAAERERAILGPLDAAYLDVALEDGLLGQILEEVANNPDALPLLEFALAELWQRTEINSAGRRLTRAAYSKIGGVTGALARHADRILAELKVDEHQARHLFMELVRVTDTLDQDARRPRSKAELDALDPTLWPLAQHLAEKRLIVMRAEAMTAEPVADVVHEALFRRWDQLRAWIAEERDFLRWRQRLDERRREWEEAGQDARELLNSRALQETERWLERHANALSEQQLRFVQASRDAVDAQATREYIDRIWNRLEFNQERMGEDEREAFLELQRATPEIRQEFLFSAATDEPRARRLCRASGVAFRAAFALDMGQAAIFASKLFAWLIHREASLGPARAQAVLLMVRETSYFEPKLVPPTLVLATTAIAGTTDSDQLQACAQVIQALASLADAATARQVIEQATTAITGTTDSYQLQAYAQVIQALASLADAATARQVIEQATTAIAGTTDSDQLQAYAQVIEALASLADAATARTAATAIVKQATTAIAGTTDSYQLQAYAQVIEALASLADAATARTAATAIVKQATTAIAETTDSDQLQVYAQVIQALASLADAATARQVIEQATTAIAGTTHRYQLQVYAQVIQALASLADAATARQVIEQATTAIAGTTHRYQLPVYAQVIQALASLADAATARQVIEQATTAITGTTDSYQLQAYAQVIQALASLADAATARQVIEQATTAITGTTDSYQLQAYAQVIQALASLADAATARQVIEQATTAITGTTDSYQLQAYAQVIQALASLADAATARTAATAIVKQATTAITTGTTHRYQLPVYAQVIQALASLADAATARTAATAIVKQATTAIAETTDSYQLQAYAQVIQALASLADAATARQVIEQATTAIAGTTHRYQLPVYAQVIQALASLADAATARQVIEQATTAITTGTTHSYQLPVYAQVIRALASLADAATAHTAATAIVKQATTAITGTTDSNQLWTYAQVIQALASLADAATARTAATAIVKQVVASFDPCDWESDFEVDVDTMVAIHREIPSAVWVLAMVEMLKHPLCGGSKDFENGIARCCGIPETAFHSLWDLLSWLEKHEPWLQLRSAFRTSKEILEDFACLEKHEPPLLAS